jgi:hypothetical protein
MPVQTMQSQALQDWAKANDPSQTDLIYKDGFWNQIMFVRDQIPAIAFEIYGQDVAMTLANSGIKVISTHTSKSVRLPVFHITMPNGDEFVMRYNFHNWKVSVKAKEMVEADFMNLFNPSSQIHSCYCEGFPPEWVFGSYENNRLEFTVELQAGENYLFTFFWIYFQKVASQRKFA